MKDHKVRRNILFIVEGQSDEPRFISKLFDVCFNDEFVTYSYNTNIHVLAKHIEEDYPDFDDGYTDIQGILRSYENDEDKIEILKKSYTDIYLIFDFEPQDRSPRFDTIKRMLAYYDDSSNQGKLFINYPMMQSYKHFAKLPDPGFNELKVSISECKDYKKIVGDISKYADINAYDYRVFVSLAVHHIRKANYILTGVYDCPTTEEYLSWQSIGIFDKQLDLVNRSLFIYVLNTCIFILVDYRPNHFFKDISTRKSDFNI